MWPWEHLAVGYLLFSLAGRLHRAVDPDDASTLLLAASTQFPDLVDKPLAWVLGVLPSGQSLAHSVFLAVPVALLAVTVGRWRGRIAAGVAVAVGYLSHLLGDVVYPLVLDGTPEWSAVLWPVAAATPERHVTLAARLQALSSGLLDTLAGEAVVVFVGFEVALMALSGALWLLDGRPGLRFLWAIGSRIRTW